MFTKGNKAYYSNGMRKGLNSNSFAIYYITSTSLSGRDQEILKHVTHETPSYNSGYAKVVFILQRLRLYEFRKIIEVINFVKP